MVVLCPRCGKPHHEDCWRGECGSYECAPGRRAVTADAPKQKITFDEVDQAVPLPPATPRGAYATYAAMPGPAVRRTSGLAIASFICALAGIPLFGVITGAVAVLLGCFALASIRDTKQKGTLLAGIGLGLGLVDVVGWVVLLSMFLGGGGPSLNLRDMKFDAADLKHLNPTIQRAMRANVVINNGHFSTGSGVILKIEQGRAVILTNQHVVNSSFSESDSDSKAPPTNNDLEVLLVGQQLLPGRLEWVAPGGVDLAVVSVPYSGTITEAAATQWNPATHPDIGDAVFAVGNPQGLNWSHTRGSISQFRKWQLGTHDLHIIQTEAPINPGNSGGGLYDAKGNLLGINTWTHDKRMSEGLGFAISVESIDVMLPDRFKPKPEAATTPAEPTTPQAAKP